MRRRVVASAGVIVFLALVASASAAPPATVTLTAPAEDARMTTRTPTLIWERSAGATRYEVHIDAGGLFAETAVVEDADCSATCSFTPLKGLSSNLYHSWKVVARNADGSTEASRRLIVDVPPTILTFHVAAPSSMHGLGPAVSVIHGPYCPRAGVTTDDPFVDNRYTLDGQPYNAESGFRWRLDCRLAAGRHTIAVNSIDQLGNSATASTTFVTDLVRPSVRIEGPARVAKGTTATFRAVVDPGTVVGPVAFSWSESWTPFGTGAELRLLANFDAADLAVSAQDAEGDEGSTLMHVETGPKPPSGKPGITAGRTSRTRRRATLRVVWPAGAKTVTLTEGRRTRTVPVARSIPWTFSGTGRRAVRARFDWPLPAKAYTARVTVHKRGSLNPRT